MVSHYAYPQVECEEKLKVFIQRMNAERKAIQERLRGISSPDKLRKKERRVWEHMKFYPNKINYSVTSRGVKIPSIP